MLVNSISSMLLIKIKIKFNSFQFNRYKKYWNKSKINLIVHSDFNIFFIKLMIAVEDR